jgi:hypothetical protein
MKINNRNGSFPGKKHVLPIKKCMLLIFFILIACVLVAGCATPTIKGTKAANSPAPTGTTSLNSTTPDVTLIPVKTANSTANSSEIKKGSLNVSISNYIGELPVFIDNKIAGNVSQNKPLNLTLNVGRHNVRICVADLCNNQDVMVLSSTPAMADFGDWLTKEIVKGPLTVSIGGYNADLPVMVDNVTAGNASQGRPLNLMVREGNHTIKVCVGILCVNETVVVQFAKPSFIDFEERLKKVAEFSKPTVQILDTRQIGAKVTVDLEFINPSKDDLTFNTTVQCAYSYIDPLTKERHGNAKQITVIKLVKAGTRVKQSTDIWMDGGRSYIIEIPRIVDTSYK